MDLLAWCNCNSHNYETAQLVGYCYNKYECWSHASVSDMHACMHKFTDMTWPDAIATDMADGRVQM